ncbi:MAG TPA: DNA polymerase/3'-5' exonuclease PolX [Ktedonobacterales bacterium]|nr:DNA polymerase/3'-5' exonuclease PolX [Ktedonobacterales bacterium]
MDKAQVASILEEIGNLLELKGGNPFEPRAYQNGARVVGALEGDINDLVRNGQIARTPGLGKTLVARITELVTTGHMALYEELLTEVPEGLREMLRIPGLGPKRVRQIHEALGIATLADLRTAAENGQIAGLPGFGEKSQEKILKGLAFVTEHQDKYRYDVAEADALPIVAALRALPQVVRISIAGSLRRHKEVVKDMDMVASVARNEDRAAVMARLVALPEVNSITGSGDTKTSVVLHSGIALDLRVVTDDEYPYALHHFTGSKEHNVALRGRAHAEGIKINEYGIFRGDTLIPCKDETDIYRALGMHYVPPELREDRGEIEAARAGELPELVTVEDLRGILHVHSTWSDGQVSIREMAQATLALGKEYLGICDHSQVAAYAHGLNAAAVRRQQEEIDRLNEEFAGRLRILKGTECDILKDGSLDFDDATLATFDFVIASIHSQFQLPPEEQTQRLIRAIENPYCSILGHPTGRILLGRAGYEPDMEKVIDRAGELGVAIELNGDPHRFDLDWRLIRYATERGVKIPICPDAHSPAGLANIRYGVGVGRKGWLTREQVLNTLPVDDLLAFFAAQRQQRGA